MFYNSAKKTAITRLTTAERRFNDLGKDANKLALRLYDRRKSAAEAINRIEKYINTLANTPKSFVNEIASIQMDIKEFHEAVKIEKENCSNNIKGGSLAGGGIATGGAIAALGPTAAMAIATTFGTASTGTAIASLSGAAATNAALAWLGGGPLAAGGGGMAAGNAFLAMAGPIGWGVAGVLVLAGGYFAAIKNKKAAEKANNCAIELEKRYRTLIPIYRKMQKLEKKTKELYSSLSITEMVNLFLNDYTKFNDEQKKKLAALINNARAMGRLINERVA